MRTSLKAAPGAAANQLRKKFASRWSGALVGVLAEIEQQQAGRILFDTRASISLTAFSESPKIRFLSGIGFVSLLDFGLFLFDVCL
jgi:hypothetical protein